jgi:beta-lactamase superfamily II metal-dependent hydrolase
MGIKIHFINVGSGDCTIVHFPERTRKDGKTKAERIMMIDINHHDDDDECEHVIDYYKNNFKNDNGSLKPIFRFIVSHPHQDHICGLNKLFADNDIQILNFWDLNHSFEPDNYDGHPTHKDDWSTYQAKRVKKEGNPTIIHTHREDPPRLYWNDDEDRIVVLAPTLEMLEKAHSKKEDGSKRKPHEIDVDRISYAFLMKVNDRKIIFAGDGKEAVWQDIFDNCKDHIKDCHILKAPHHGHESAFHEETVKLMNPAMIVFSNSEDEDADNGAADLYAAAAPNALILKTCEHGTIVADCPFDINENITYTTSK